MARLSTPAADTPKSERKSNRFREIFKHRASSSASSTPARFIEASQAIDPSPSPSVKPGFQKIGLLPCERISLSSLGNLGKGSYEGTIKEEPTVSEEHDGGPVSVPVQDKKIANLIDNGEPNAGCQGSTDFEFPLGVPNNAQRSSLPPNLPHRIAEAMHGILVTPQAHAPLLTKSSQKQQRAIGV
ncbi:hypothetical protein GMOD_00002724 [Pyrenophora seminiperda CCB06]|uniref:Uncharacterized protein n=1 Tax=Pyrenophora seminiperda CCB06 TaxID=1302712 RepID=A0A3M7M329_9PLEO|nr:hypothetical protein GMOD_00002724 [Pyrenophora seminiperda CCB06]